MRYFLIAALFVIACAFVFRTVRGGETPKVEAVLAFSKAPSRGINPRLELTLTNRGDQPVSLVLPGDGSECGARTPRLNYTWLRDGNIVVPPVPGFTCGNVNPLRAGEVAIVHCTTGQLVELFTEMCLYTEELDVVRCCSNAA